MKKILSILTLMSILFQFGFVVQVQAAGDLYEMKLTAPGKYTDGVTGTSDTTTVQVVKDDDESLYVCATDLDSSVNANITKYFNAPAKFTISFDVKVLKGAARIYLGMQITGAVLPTGIAEYKDGQGVSTNAVLDPEVWSTVDIVVDVENKKYDIYCDGINVHPDVPFRQGSIAVGGRVGFQIFSQDNECIWHLRNYKISSGEVISPVPERMLPYVINPDRYLIQYHGAEEKIDKALGNSVVMTVGNSGVRVGDKFTVIDEERRYVAPFVTEDGHTLIPTRFTTEAIGCEVEVLSNTSFRFSKDGTVMEINMGDKYATINGQRVEMPTYPQIKYDRLFIPLRFAAETFGKTVFWDNRGLIVISDGEVLKEGQEEIIKPLIAQIREYTTVMGNRKHSDVDVSSRFWDTQSYGVNANGDMGSAVMMKMFMGTINRWTYIMTEKELATMEDLGVLNQTSINATVQQVERHLKGNEEDALAYFIDGDSWKRGDGQDSWGCISKPEFMDHLKTRIDMYLENGASGIIWQFDDGHLLAGSDVNISGVGSGGCFCEDCQTQFNDYMRNGLTEEQQKTLMEKDGVDYKTFDYLAWAKGKGVVNPSDYGTLKLGETYVRELYSNWMGEKVFAFHKELKEYIEEKVGAKVLYSFNSNMLVHTGAADTVAGYRRSQHEIADGLMAESHVTSITPSGNLDEGLLSSAYGVYNIVSPTPSGGQSFVDTMHAGAAMSYATGNHTLVVFDTYINSTTRYYSSVEEWGGVYEFAREYPYLLDNYEIPSPIAYVIDYDKYSTTAQLAQAMLDYGVPAKYIVNANQDASRGLSGVKITENHLAGVEKIVAVTDYSDMTPEEQQLLENSGIPTISIDDVDARNALYDEYFTVRNNEKDVYTILRTNQIYENAPVIVHAVDYDMEKVKENVEIELNNRWLPEGDEITITFYQPWSNKETITVKKGAGTTKVVIPKIDRWTVLSISGDNTVARDVRFDLGDGYNGIGMGTRISYDSAYGTPENFTITTYSEGIHSGTLNDGVGTQDEVAFIYRRIANSGLKSPIVSASFEGEGQHGVMMREGIQCSTRFVGLVYDEDNGLRLAYRPVTDKAVLYKDLGTDEYEYMRLVKEGKDYVAYVSDDGATYTEIGRIEFSLETIVPGVFAASPDGKKSTCRVYDMLISEGNYAAEEFNRFQIKYEGEQLKTTSADEKLTINLSTESVENLGTSDVKIDFVSSNPEVAEIKEDGTIVVNGAGDTTITATARMNLKSITAKTKLNVEPVETMMFEANFDSKEAPAEATRVTGGDWTYANGTARLNPNSNGGDGRIYFKFDQYPVDATLEFDFRANYGTMEPTTGARLVYAHGDFGACLVSEKEQYNWFYGGDQLQIPGITFVPDEWHHIKMEFDYKEQTCNVYIDDQLVVENEPVRGSIGPNGEFSIGAWRTSADGYYEWDNFKFYIDEKYGK